MTAPTTPDLVTLRLPRDVPGELLGARQSGLPMLRHADRDRDAELVACARDLAAGPLAVGSADVGGRFDRAAGRALQLKVEASAVGWQAVRIDRLQGELEGSLDEHRIVAEVVAPLQPPPALAQTLGWQQGSAARASLSAAGGWTGAATGGGRWSGRLARLAVGADAGAPGDANGSWLDTAELPLEWTLGTAGSVDSVRLQAGRARSGGGTPCSFPLAAARAVC